MPLSHGPLPHPTSATLTLSRGVQDPTHPERGCHSNTEGFEFLDFLNFLYLFLTGLQTGQGLALVHRPHCEHHCHNQSLQQPSENLEGYPHLTFQTKTLKHSGLPNLKSPHSPGSRTWIQAQSVPRGASICPWFQSLCFSPCACIILTTCGGRTVWFRPSDEDLLKYTFYIPQTSFIHTHILFSSPGDKNLQGQWFHPVSLDALRSSSQPKQWFNSRNCIHFLDKEAEIQRLRCLPEHVTKTTWL